MTFPWPSRTAVLLALVLTAALGVALRLHLAGLVPLPGEFPNVRHAHSHAGVYAVFFPLAFAAWAALEIEVPGRRVMAVYLAASAVAVGGFAASGYAFWSIVASTCVGIVWLYAAFLGRAVVRRETGALRMVPFALVGSTLFIPPIALATSRDPGFAQDLAHSFLATLFLLVMVPTALRAIGASTLDARVFVPAAALSAAHLGAAPSRVGSVALAVLGIQVARAVWKGRDEASLRAAWGMFALGAVALASFPVPPYDLSVGGVHYLLLGPLFASLAALRPTGTWLVTLTASWMAFSLGPLSLTAGGATVQLSAALAGVAWAVCACLSLLWGSDRRHTLPDPSPPTPIA
jgi:hypothetical protein